MGLVPESNKWLIDWLIVLPMRMARFCKKQQKHNKLLLTQSSMAALLRSYLTISITVHDGHIIKWQCTEFFLFAAFAFDGNAMNAVGQPKMQPRKMRCQVGNRVQNIFGVVFWYGNYRQTRLGIVRRLLSDPVEHFQTLSSCVDVRRYKAGAVTGTSVRLVHRSVTSATS